MKCFGTVFGTSSDGNTVISCTETPNIGDDVYDGGRKRVGRIKRIFGPVDAPYAVMSTEGRRVPAGSKLFIDGGPSNGKAKRRNGRDHHLP